MKLSRAILWSVLALFQTSTFQHVLQAQDVNLGMVKLASKYGAYLQCHCAVGDTGELHASHTDQYQEETWYVILRDHDRQRVSLQNFRNGYFIQRHTGGAGNHRAETIAHNMDGFWTVWVVIHGKDHGLPDNFVAFQSMADNSYLLANPPGQNASGERGEVYTENDPTLGDANWQGWWRITAVPTDPGPQPGWTDAIAHPFVEFGKGAAHVLSVLFDRTRTSNHTFSLDWGRDGLVG